MKKRGQREAYEMNRKRLGQFLIGGVLSACAVVITALVDLIAKEEQKNPADDSAESPDETGGRGR